MHLLVPGAYRLGVVHDMPNPFPSQCTFWCRVLTDGKAVQDEDFAFEVSMHLLVPGAYRHFERYVSGVPEYQGSQCTFWCRVLTDRNPYSQ